MSLRPFVRFALRVLVLPRASDHRSRATARTGQPSGPTMQTRVSGIATRRGHGSAEAPRARTEQNKSRLGRMRSGAQQWRRPIFDGLDREPRTVYLQLHGLFRQRLCAASTAALRSALSMFLSISRPYIGTMAHDLRNSERIVSNFLRIVTFFESGTTHPRRSRRGWMRRYAVFGERKRVERETCPQEPPALAQQAVA